MKCEFTDVGMTFHRHKTDLSTARRQSCKTCFPMNLLKLHVVTVAFSFITCTLFAQDNSAALNGISARVLFLDYHTPNGIGSFKITNGLEISYVRDFGSHFGLGIPFKIGVANIGGMAEKSTLFSIDLTGRYFLSPSGKKLRPWFFAGGGIVLEDLNNNNFQIPIGVGINYQVGGSSAFSLQAEYRKSTAEDRDNFQLGVGWHFILKPDPEIQKLRNQDSDGDGLADFDDQCPNEAGTATTFGCPDSDNDNVPNAIDECPMEAGLVRFNGCPDSDTDGLPDHKDKCPLQAGIKKLDGCPETVAADHDDDGDGIPDDKDLCPHEAGTIAYNGCPAPIKSENPIPPAVNPEAKPQKPASPAQPSNVDSDGDGLTNVVDECPNNAGPIELKGCPDTDGDGLRDIEDRCPAEAGPKERYGCPPKDSDNDGIMDENDLCPNQAGPITTGGCPDADGDAITDDKDQCPNEAGKVATKGCPDRDVDSVPDKDDNCPDKAGLPQFGGCPDSDADGIADDKDECPNQPGPAQRNGCPHKDSDGDGILDDDDKCPNLKGNITAQGCPDKDGDGIMDEKDQCPTEAGPASRKGCPHKDSDADGILDDDDNCPNIKGSITAQGCPDKDGDGIEDKNDKCPNEAGPHDRNGCPRKDSDGDGILDEEDNCPNLAGSLTSNGCPDADGDGVNDSNDKCPQTYGTYAGCPDSDGDGVHDGDDECILQPGPAAAKGCPDRDADSFPDVSDKCPDESGTNQGCPDLKPEEKKFLADAARAVQFEVGKATLKAESYSILDQVAEIIKKYPRYSLSIEGHTDNVGNEANNKQLSEERAKSCYEYLIARGVANERMKYVGFGESKPIADNSTQEGRDKNRRVEFVLYLK